MTEGEDLEAFIQEQKAKIAKERQTITKQEPTSERRKWDKRPPAEILVSSNHDKPPETPEETGLAFEGYGYEEHRKKLLEERKKEYNEILSEQPHSDDLQEQIDSGKHPSDSPAYKGLLVGTDDEKQKKLQEERKKEYNELIQKGKAMNQNKENVPPKPETPELGFIAKLGEYEKKRKKLQEERRREYNELLAAMNARQRRRRGDDDSYLDAGNSLPDRSAVQQEKKRREQEKYKESLNEQLREQRTKRGGTFKPYARHDYELSDDDSPRGKSRRRQEDEYVTLPGLRDHASAEIRKMHERNREYNEFLNSKRNASRVRSRAIQYPDSDEDDDRPVPRKGWATPTYEEILEKKRREERSYRRHNDPEYANGLRSSRSESNLHRAIPDPYEEDERRFRNLDREYESKKVHFRADKQHVNPELEFSEWPEHTRHHGDRTPSHYDDYSTDSRMHDNRRNDGRIPENYRRESHHNDKRRSYSRQAMDNYGATLPIGSEQRASAEQRKKETYRKELEQQMRELKEKRKKEHLDDLKPYPMSSRPERQQYPERRDVPSQQPSTSSRWRDDFSPRANSIDDSRKPRPSSILENGFEDLYRPSLPPQPSLGAYRTPMDDAYMYYANKNPLDIAGGIGLDPLAPLSRPLDRVLDRPPERTERPKVTFENGVKPDAYREPQPARTPFPVDDDRSRAQKEAQKAYQEELKRQIEEQKILKQKEKEERERYDRKLDEEIRKYDPFGRGGGGAPMRDTEGNVIADRRQLREEASDPYKAIQPPPESVYPPTTVKIKSDQDGESFARGGHGIFGEPLSDAEKMKRNRYQEELRKQIEEQKRLQELEKAKIKEEEEKLMKKIEEEQRKMQEELEAERRKEREKQEAAQRQQEELRRQQEERKKEEERRRQEAEERRQEELRRQEEERRRERQMGSAKSRERTSSPPIPALRPKGEESKQEQTRAISPPVPAIRSKTEPPASPPVPAQRSHSRPQSRIASADVLNQLSRMRQQLQNERKRVESDLKKEQDEPEVFDPRLHTKAPSRNNVDIFEIARKKEAATVRRPPADTNMKNVEDFKALKNKDGKSRSEFRKLFPQTPDTSDALETQQRVLLMQQEEHLNDLRQRNDPYSEPDGLGRARRGSTTSAALLESDSAFLEIPEDPPDPYGRSSRTRNDSARSRRRMRSNTPKNTRTESVGSLTSLDPDIITRKNEDRLRKLKSLAGDDMSLASADPDEVLDRFMAKQQHTRPPSEQTLVDDSWIRPETKVA